MSSHLIYLNWGKNDTERLNQIQWPVEASGDRLGLRFIQENQARPPPHFMVNLAALSGGSRAWLYIAAPRSQCFQAWELPPGTWPAPKR